MERARPEAAPGQRSHGAIGQPAAESARESAHLLSMACRMARLGGWLVELEEARVYLSDEVCAIHGLPPGTSISVEEAIGFYAPAWRPLIRERFARCAREGTPYDLELQILTADGCPVWVRTIGEALRDAHGRIRRVQGAFQDISERKETEERLEESEHRLRLLAESMPLIVWGAGPDGRLAYYTEALSTYTGRGHGELLGDAWLDVLHPDDRERTVAARTRSVESGTPHQIEFRIRRHDGVYRWHLTRAVPYRNDDGEIVQWYGTATDIHDHITAERRLREQAELLDRAQDAILLVELDQTIVYWSAGAERTYGWTRDEVVGKRLGDLLCKHPSALARGMVGVLEAGAWSGEVEHTRKGGAAITAEARLSLVRDAHGTPQRILAIFADITERKRLHAQLLRAQRLESIGTLAGGIAHDINNVLTPILLSIHMLKEGIADKTLREKLATIEASAERGAALVRQVMAFARGVEGAKVPIDLARLLADLEGVVRDTFPKSITLETRIPGDLHPLVGDPTQLHQVLMNLFVNARDAMPEGGTLSVTAETVALDEHDAAMRLGVTPGPYVRVTVTDTGAGMAPDVLECAFDPFFTTKEVGQGTGLGLSTVASILRGHGGSVQVDSESGRGTSFHLYIPAAAGEHASAPAEAAPSTPPRGEGELILVVDDEHAVRAVTQQTLEAFGYRCVTAVDGADAVAAYGRHGSEIALVLTDIMMPILDGVAMARVLRRMDPDLRIIAASGLGSEGGLARAADAGVRHFLPKPYTSETLLRAVDQALRAPAR